MIPTIAAIIGAGLGALLARWRGGNQLDLLHYAAVFAIFGFVLSIGILVLT